MGGSIELESTPGEGSRFRFWARLPEVSEEQRATFAAAHGLGQLTILLASADRELGDRIAGILTGYQATVCRLAVDDAADADCLDSDLAIVALPAGRARDELVACLSDRSVPFVTLGGTAPQQGTGDRVRRLPSQPRRRALLDSLSDLAANARDAAPQDEFDQAAPWVLVAEDNTINQKVVEAMLRRLGCEVVIAADGVHAVEAHSAAAFDLVLMDYQMPNLDGPEATRRIREQEVEQSRRRTPIVALTANVGADFRQHCLAAGMDGFLSKPVQRADLQRVLDAHVLRVRVLG